MHNADYLSDEALQLIQRLSIHSANIAPEFGLTETRAFMGLLESAPTDGLLEQFSELAIASGRWKKWLLPETQPTPRELTLIAGHYVFSHPEFIRIKENAAKLLNMTLGGIDDHLKNAVRQSMMRYMKNFRLIKEAAVAAAAA